MNDTLEAHGHGDADHGEVTPTRHAEHTHPGNAEYIRIALILAAITAVEVVIYYFDLNKATLIGGLFVLSATKFVLVAAFFMHLKFDSRIFSIFFAGGIITALLAFIAVLTMLRAF